MISILFVCKGNICRSPMAEAVMNDLIKREGLSHEIKVDSAGVREWHIGKPPHQKTQEVLEKHGVPWKGMVARQLTKDDFPLFDLIVGMDENNRQAIKEMEPGKTIYLLTDFIKKSGVKEVPDPYHTGKFDETYELVLEGCQGLLDSIRKEDSRP